jgi:hypothetical protein
LKDAVTFRLTRLVALLILVGGVAAPAAGEEPAFAPYSAEYKVKISILSGRLTTDLRRTDDGYEAEHVVRPSGFAKVIRNGVISEKSRFSATEEGVRSSWYQSVNTLSSDETSADVIFDWASNEIAGTVNEEEVNLVLDELALDRVALQYQLMHDLANGGAEERYILFDLDEFKTLVVRSIGTREIKTPVGTFEAIGIQHQRENSSRVTTFWCVQELGYLPAMIERHRKGKLQMRATLRKYSPLET